MVCVVVDSAFVASILHTKQILGGLARLAPCLAPLA